MKKSAPSKDKSASHQIDAKLKSLNDWRGELLSRLRSLIRQAVPDVFEEIKWKKPSNPSGVPVWSHHGIICTGETYKDKVKLTFDKGASLDDPTGLFNASLTGNQRRAIDLSQEDKINVKAFKALIRAAADLNVFGAQSKATTANKSNKMGSRASKLSKETDKTPSTSKPKLLSGGNPQIAKGDGDGPVQAYLAAMPDWKRDVGRRLDALIEQAVPNVRKAVRWNSPFYGIEGQGWFLAMHCFNKYVKVSFLNGSALRPLPPIESKVAGTRYVHLVEDDQFDEELMSKWVKQAVQLPGEKLF